MAQRTVTMQQAASKPLARARASSLVPMAAMGLVLALATLLVSIILRSPVTHGNLRP
ncbi:MAG: hypothetical protein HY330_06800 [Chloroflexi bacterium]|nr:hypothetical protein [Chloroflexota bacterium]